ncbi:hypothetical protein [Bradyrhizobium archetypum]|uniref:Uncharacterized protein n=1 Tax=Bradyrhizobium archetypum TaxID=2721160 RepID=A0A7Y4HAF0_9BRAD|nr:hypothetical protein [Bradyrhizobium archetypum]NOJ50092.1 hypothetical protein [Bradyrhizobium archetypum]
MADALVEQIRPLLARTTPEVQGATIGPLVAIFIAGHLPKSTNSCPGIGDIRTSLTRHKRAPPSAQDELTTGRPAFNYPQISV